MDVLAGTDCHGWLLTVGLVGSWLVDWAAIAAGLADW